MYVQAGLYHGGKLLQQLGEPVCEAFTTEQQRTHNPRWHQWLTFELETSKFPSGTRLCLTVWNRQKFRGDEEVNPLGWVNLPIFDDVQRMRTGIQRLKLWPKDKANPIGTCVDNISSKELTISCKTKEGITFLLKTLGEETKKLTSLSDMTIGPNRLRHIAHLKETKESLQLGIEELKAGKIEIAADFTRAASMSLGRIIGAVDIEDVLDDLFLGFCIGK